MQSHKSSALASLAEEDEPAWSLQWASALSREQLQPAELEALSPKELAEFLVDYVKAEKREVKGHGIRVVENLLCLKYASDLDLSRHGPDWRVEVRPQMPVCQTPGLASWQSDTSKGLL